MYTCNIINALIPTLYVGIKLSYMVQLVMKPVIMLIKI